MTLMTRKLLVVPDCEVGGRGSARDASRVRILPKLHAEFQFSAFAATNSLQIGRTVDER
jgi:hypothetical protein